MRRSDRLFEIIQILRSETQVITASEIAARLEVSTRTIYRDIQALQAMRTPIEGEAGIGYLMRQGYDLPPLNFSVEEVEAALTRWNVARERDPRTGDVAHPPLVYVLDREGRIAYATAGGVDAMVELLRRG